MDLLLKALIGNIDPFYDLIVETGRFHEAIINGGTLAPLFDGGSIDSVKITKL
jgi:hypothetical protein